MLSSKSSKHVGMSVVAYALVIPEFLSIVMSPVCRARQYMGIALRLTGVIRYRKATFVAIAGVMLSQMIITASVLCSAALMCAAPGIIEVAAFSLALKKDASAPAIPPPAPPPFMYDTSRPLCLKYSEAMLRSPLSRMSVVTSFAPSWRACLIEGPVEA